MKNHRLRFAWIIPNIVCYCMLLGGSAFVLMNVGQLEEMDVLVIWGALLLLLLLVSLFGSYRIWIWIKEGKM